MMRLLQEKDVEEDATRIICEWKVPQTLYHLKEPSLFPFIVYNHFFFQLSN
jgi:hypothetical protein